MKLLIIITVILLAQNDARAISSCEQGLITACVENNKCEEIKDAKKNDACWTSCQEAAIKECNN